VLDVPEAARVGDVVSKLVRIQEKGQVTLLAAARKRLGPAGNRVRPRSPFGTCGEFVGERECFTLCVLWRKSLSRGPCFGEG
jgi:hypothetical protein